MEESASWYVNCYPEKEMNRSPAYSFIRERVELEFQKLEKEKVTPWIFMPSGKPFRLTNFFGKEINYSGVGFEGSPRTVFWKGFIQPFLQDIVSRSFSETRNFCLTHNVEPKRPMEETAVLLKAGIKEIYRRMSDIDQRLRGKGQPNSVSKYEPETEIALFEAFIEERFSAERALTPKKRKTLNTFYEEQKFWFWFIGIVIAAAGVLLKFLG
jgi:hypothetical protein